MRGRWADRASWGLHAALTLVLALLSVMVATGCVGIPIPYPVKPEFVQNEAITLSAEHTLVSMEDPRGLLKQVFREIQKANPNIEVVDGLTFRELAFPERNWTLAWLLERVVCEQLREKLDLAYLVLVGFMKYEEDEGRGFYTLLGIAAAVDTKSNLSAVIVDLQSREIVCRVTAEAHGAQAIFYPFVYTEPLTDSAAIRGLGDEIAKIVHGRAGGMPVRIAVMAGEPTMGDVETKWQLYAQSPEPGEREWRWLCQAADQGHALARRV